jgi:hypothetical protein
MLETVYGSGLTAGTTRQEFEAAGLVPSTGAASTSRAEPGPSPKGRGVRQEGLETVVIKPFCTGKRP